MTDNGIFPRRLSGEVGTVPPGLCDHSRRKGGRGDTGLLLLQTVDLMGLWVHALPPGVLIMLILAPPCPPPASRPHPLERPTGTEGRDDANKVGVATLAAPPRHLA